MVYKQINNKTLHQALKSPYIKGLSQLGGSF
jgi:hypothetical protein